MTTKTGSTADPLGHSQGYQTCIGDLLIHSEKKVIVLPVILQSLAEKVPSSSSPVVPNDQPIIHRLAPKHPSVSGIATTAGADLKNNYSVKPANERTTKTFSTKNVLRVHKAGWALVKEIKSKVLTAKLSDENFYSVAQDDSSERTHF